MDDIELDDLGDRRKDRPPEDDRGEEETTLDDDWRNESLLDFNDDNPGGEIPNPRKDADVMRRAYTEDKKNLLRELNINVNKGDGPSARSLFERLKVTVTWKGKINGAEFDGVRIIVQRGMRLVFTEEVKKVSKLNELNSLARKAQEEHSTTPVVLMEESLDMTVDENLADSVLRSSLERLNEEISEKADWIAAKLTENELREFRGMLDVRLPTVEQQREGGITVEGRIDAIRTEETHWRNLAERQADPEKKLLYESIANVAGLKADEMRLRANIRPDGELARSIVEEEAEDNDLAKFERFKRWARRNLGGISVVAISVAGIITTIVMGARNAVKRGASATSKLAKTLGKIAEKAAPVLGALLNLVAGVLKLGAKAVGFLSENLWL